MSKFAKPYKTPGGWCLRRRVRGQNFFVSGQISSVAARVEMVRQVAEFLGARQQQRLAQARANLGQALTEYVEETFPCREGAKQNRRRRRPACCNTSALSQAQVHAFIARALEVSNA